MGLIQRIVGALLGVLFLVAVFIFASFILAILVVASLVIWGWLWWRSRTRSAVNRRGGGTVIEGEYRDETPSQRLDDRGRDKP